MTVGEGFTVGDNVMITVSNRPWLDMSVPVESNDYMPVELANIKIYSPCGDVLMDSSMCAVYNKVGWYFFNYQTNQECNPPGLYKVVVELGCSMPACLGQTVCTTGTSGTRTSGTSGDDGLEWVTSKKVGYFRLLKEGVV